MTENVSGRATDLRTDLLPPRFWSKVRKTPSCWLWTGGTSKGYGMFWWHGRTVPAHRLCYESLVGPVPDNCEIDHVCRNRACVNPDPKHLRAVDHQTNVVAGIGRSAINAAKVCCPKGHPYTTEIRKDRSSGVQRRCIQCCRERGRERAAKIAREARRLKWLKLWAGTTPKGAKQLPRAPALLSGR